MVEGNLLVNHDRLVCSLALKYTDAALVCIAFLTLPVPVLSSTHDVKCDTIALVCWKHFLHCE